MKQVIELFDSRLITLSQLIDQASSHFGNVEFLDLRLIDDMLPLGTQVAFTCNQPWNFVQWLRGQEVQNLEPDLADVAQAQQLVSNTRDSLSSIDPESATLPQAKRLDFDDKRYVQLTGSEYIDDFLVPNFYFHLVTAYDILRAKCVKIGKANYMSHLAGKVRESTDD